jgi:hypothetical protein
MSRSWPFDATAALEASLVAAPEEDDGHILEEAHRNDTSWQWVPETGAACRNALRRQARVFNNTIGATMDDTSDRKPFFPIGIIELATSDVIVKVVNFRQKTRVDVRHYVESNAAGMPQVPTKKGINFTIDELPKVVGTLADVLAAARAAGILPPDDTAPTGV